MTISITSISVGLVVAFTLCQVRTRAEEYCQTEVFQPQCTKNDVILMRNATYGRMSIGRCVTAEEVNAHRAVAGDDPRYFRCSVDVSEILDQKCSGQTNCEVRVVDISKKTISPCFPGLVVYLEASYECITVADEKRSCLIKALMNPTHIISSFANQRTCGTKSQPWIIESPAGQKIKVTLIDFNGKVTDDENKQQCHSYGSIVDTIGNRSVSICGDKERRQRNLYESKGNHLEIHWNSFDLRDNQDNMNRFILSIEAVGCSDIIPPEEETWLRRKDDVIVIGCYSTQQTWQLNCNEGKWIGVLGNCSTNNNQGVSHHNEKIIDMELKSMISEQEQVLAIVAISGCTFAVCLIIVCVGTICLRRFYVRYKIQHDYKTLSLRRNPEVKQHLIEGIPYETTTDSVEADDLRFTSKQLPTYSVYAGDIGFNENRDNANILTNNANQ